MIGDLCEVVNGGTPRTGVADYWGGPHAWITPAEMGRRLTPYVSKTTRTLTDAGIHESSAQLLPPLSVILSSRAPIGHLVINRVPMATNQGCKGLVPREDLDHKFLFYYLTSIVSVLEELGTGTTFKELSGSKLKEVPIAVPPLPEQHRIVAMLDEAFAGIAKARENTERNLENAREVFDSFLQGIFSTPQTGWQRTTVDRLSTNLDGRRIPITKADRVAGIYPYYGASGIVDHVADYRFDGDTLLVSEDGANLLARSTPIAFSVSGRYWVNNHAHVLKFKHRATQRFVEFYLESIRIDEFVTGAAQPKLTQKALNSIPIPIPENVDEQARIVDSIELSQAETQHLTALYQRKLAALDALKQSLLHQAFHGDL